MVLFSIVSLFLLVLILYCCCCFILILKNNTVIKAFNDVDTLLKKRYAILLDIVNGIKSDSELKEEIIKLRTEVILLGTKRENIDRRIALDCELAKKTAELLKDNSLIDIGEYSKINQDVVQSQKIYNAKAENLKHAILVFPTSFAARLLRIKTLDLFRI